MKDAAGSLTGDKGKQAEGMADRAAGAAREKYGEAREAVEDASEPKPGQRKYDDTDEDE